jgi:Rhodopirellula transposase DDE domain
MADLIMIETLKEKFEALQPLMSERLRRYWAATEAKALGYGGIAAVTHATGLSRNTITRGLAELAAPQSLSISSPTRSRRPGGGRPPVIATDPAVLQALETLVEPTTRGDPMSPLRWTCKSTRKLAEALQQQGHHVGARTVARLLHALDYSLQANRKTREGSSHPDRNAQFAYINVQVRAFQERGQPVVSIDAKKKELVGDFANKGQEWQPQGTPEEVGTHDFPEPHLGKAIPYGVYDMTTNHGWVSVGIDHDTAQFATATLRRWWQAMGSQMYPQAAALLVTADSGGSNSRRSRLWKVALQAVADEIGLPVSVCHFPPGTSKWNKIEHRMFCHITENWRGRPLRSLEVIVHLIGNTTTTTGLQIQAELDTHTYPTGLKVSAQELAAVQITKATFHSEWNYTISPR